MRTVAIKKLRWNPIDLNDESLQTMFDEEIKFNQTVRHPNIVEVSLLLSSCVIHCVVVVLMALPPLCMIDHAWSHHHLLA